MVSPAVFLFYDPIFGPASIPQPVCLSWPGIRPTPFRSPGHLHRLEDFPAWKWVGVGRGEWMSFLWSRMCMASTLLCLFLTQTMGLFGLDFGRKNGNDVYGGSWGGCGPRQIGYNFQGPVPALAHCYWAHVDAAFVVV